MCLGLALPVMALARTWYGDDANAGMGPTLYLLVLFSCFSCLLDVRASIIVLGPS